MNNLFDLNFYNKNINSLVNDLKNEIDENNKVSIFTPNIDHIINNYNNATVENIYKKSEYIIADGWPVVATGRLKKMNIDRITGVDLMDNLLKISNENRYNLFFLGATDETLIKLKNNIKNKYPNIRDIGLNHGYFKNDIEVIDKINESKAKIVFVGMGNPKQEMWIRENFSKLDANLLLGVGGAFKIFSEEVERAPKYIQKIGIEWFYRFLKEPKRLFSRYFIKYPQFLRIFIEEIVK